MAEVKVEEKSNNFFKYFIFFILFMGIGVALGIFGTKKYMEYKDSKKPEEKVIEAGPEDITNVDEYADLINKLHSFVVEYPIFYTTQGVRVENMSNNDRLMMAYDYVNKDNKITEEKITATRGEDNCFDTFALDDSTNIWLRDNGCTVKKVESELLKTKNKEIFNDELIDTTTTFVNSDGKFCMVSEGKFYLCGNKLNETPSEGKLESKFSVIKATKDEGVIVLYEKGYLLDNRTQATSLIGGHDKYYLHSADSKDYYYELKNADNLTFKHTFKTTDRINYYYVSTELFKE